MPFHVTIWPKTARQQTLRELYAFNLSDEQLRTRFIAPHDHGEPITWNGRTLDGGDVSYLKVSYTEHPLDERAVRASFQEYEAFNSGVDVTNEWILGGPGHARQASSTSPHTPEGPIFVVHGRDHSRLHEAVRALERGTGREVVVLHEQANSGRTLLEKFEDHAGEASYAVVLLTGDDEGGASTDSARNPRARQNVVFELGFFFGRLGRRRVAVLFDEGVEKPSDIEGLVYIGLDAAGAWKHTLARELTAAGIEVDRSRIP